MDNIPEIVLIKILRFLNIKVKTQCAQVCRRWRLIINSIPNYELCIHSGPFPYNKNFGSTNLKLSFHNSIELSPDYNLNLNFYRLNYSMIYQLYLDNCYTYSTNKKYIIDDLESFLKLFKYLKILEIHSLKLVQINLELNDLEILTMKGCMIYDLTINSPKLKSFVVWNYFGEIKLKSIDNLKYFESDEYYNDILNYSNLEYLNIKFRNPIDKNLIENLTKLKQLNLFSYTTNQLSFVNQLIDEQIRLKRFDLTISFLGFKSTKDCLIDNQFFDDLNCLNLNDDNLKVIKNEFNRIIFNIDWTTKINYNYFLKYFHNYQTNQLINFHSKFINIIDIELIDTLDDHKLFFNFINQCDNNIQFLTIKLTNNNNTICKTINDQIFFNQLSIYLPSLLDLKLQLNNWSIYDNEFLNNFKNLLFLQLEYTSISIDYQTIKSILIDLIFNCFNKCHYFREFYFKNHNLEIRLRYLEYYYLNINNNNFSFNNLENAIHCLIKIIGI